MHSSIEGEIREPKETRDSQREREEGEEEEAAHKDSRQQAAGSWTATTTTTGTGAGAGAGAGAPTATACPAVIPAQLAVNASAAAALLAANFTTAPAVAQWAAAASAVVVGHQAGSSRRCVDSGPPSGTAIDMDTAMAAAARMNIKTPPRPRHSIRSCWPSYCCRVSNWQVSEAPTDIDTVRLKIQFSPQDTAIDRYRYGL